jgi:dTDP-4-dehydrorhamnose 3,5-epimerase-like enzyme
MSLEKVTIRTLPIISPPIPEGGGRIANGNGELAQIVNGAAFRFLAYLEFKPQSTLLRGNHFHERKTETLYVLAGQLDGFYEDLDTGESAVYRLNAGDVVTIRPRCAHAYRPLKYTQAVEMSDETYDASDTHPYQLQDK